MLITFGKSSRRPPYFVCLPLSTSLRCYTLFSFSTTLRSEFPNDSNLVYWFGIMGGIERNLNLLNGSQLRSLKCILSPDKSLVSTEVGGCRMICFIIRKIPKHDVPSNPSPSAARPSVRYSYCCIYQSR